MVELNITIKGEESSYKQKFLVYEEIVFKEDDPVIKKCLNEALSNAKIEPDDIKIRALMVVQ